MRILVDYRPALRERTGVGEFVHGMVAALADGSPDELAIFTSSWKDRPPAGLGEELGGVAVVDRRVPVRLLTFAWNRFRWPPIERLAAAAEVIHSATPLLIPARRAAQVSTIHDLHFLRHPERLSAEMRRDFPALVATHAARAHAIVVSSAFARADVIRTLGVPAERVYACPPGAPAWAAELATRRQGRPRRHILSLGTIEPRKNLGVLLDAYAALRTRQPGVPPLVLAGHTARAPREWLDRLERAPLAGHVTVTGYVSDEQRRTLLADAHMLVMPSLDEGFGLPVLEAMTAGLPVVVSSGGSLPEVVGAVAEPGAAPVTGCPAATPIDPGDVDGFATAMGLLLDPELASDAAARAVDRARAFRWGPGIATLRAAYRDAVARR